MLYSTPGVEVGFNISGVAPRNFQRPSIKKRLRRERMDNGECNIWRMQHFREIFLHVLSLHALTIGDGLSLC